MKIEAFYDPRTSTLTYVVFDPASRDAIVIDPVLDYEPRASRTWTESVDVVVRFLENHDLTLKMILETHAHADHLSGAQRLKERFADAPVAVGSEIKAVQKIFKQVFGLPASFPTDGRQFDRLLDDQEVVEAGALSFRVIHTPGHTPACASYLFGDALFTGDTLFMPDGGTGRCDFPGGSAELMYDSIADRLYTLPEDTRVFVGHDYQPGGREVAWETTIGAQKANNIQLPVTRSKAEYIAFRERRDATLSAPQLLFQSVQVNIDAGHLPSPEANEVRYLRIPVNVFRPETSGPLSIEAP